MLSCVLLLSHLLLSLSLPSPQLQVLEVSANRLKQLPSSLGGCTALEQLLAQGAILHIVLASPASVSLIVSYMRKAGYQSHRFLQWPSPSTSMARLYHVVHYEPLIFYPC